MQRDITTRAAIAAAVLAALLLAQRPAAADSPLGSSFMYQGRLLQDGAPANGAYAMTFRLFGLASGGAQVGGDVALPGVVVTDGLFSVELNAAGQFGPAALQGSERWLEVVVNGTPLAPRQHLAATPYALYAAGPWKTVNAGLSYTSGNVGVGTSTPAATLDVNGTIQTGGFRMPTGAVAGRVLGADAAGNASWQADGLTLPYTGIVNLPGETAAAIFANSGNSGTARALYASTASPGGTAAQFAAVSSTGTAYGSFSAIASPSGAGAIAQTTNGTGDAKAFWGIQGSPDGWAGYFQGRGYFSDRLGVGTTSPSMSVHAMSPTYYGGPTVGVDTGSAWAYLYGGAPHSLIWNDTTDLRFGIEPSRGSGYTELMRIRSNGRVGIGTPTPNTRLHVSDATTTGAAVYVEAAALNSVAIQGNNFNASVGYGVYGYSAGSSGYGVFCQGRFGATGTKSFVIDHPTDPANKYLLHYSTEGSEPLNAYSGNVTTDGHGLAWVELPSYFEEINRDYRYSLTVVDDSDDFVQAKIKRPIDGNKFLVATSKPNTLVSWRVEGVRNDRWMRANGAPIEVDKPQAERGRYVNPELWGASPESRLNYAAPPEADQKDESSTADASRAADER